MKRLWACAIIFVLLVTVCTLGTIQTSKISSDLTVTVQNAKKAAEEGNDDLAFTLSQKAINDWQESHRVLCTYMPHAKLEAIDQTLGALPSLSYYRATDNFTAECDRGILQIQYLKESEVPLFENIF